jgi:hypothetical protein
MSFPMKNVIACIGGSISPACMESRGGGCRPKARTLQPDFHGCSRCGGGDGPNLGGALICK